MLAAKRSLGNLRAVSQVSAPCSPARPSRTLMTALLSSRGQFEGKTVKELQAELGDRGLKTTGKKSVLIDRLVQYSSTSSSASLAQKSFSTSHASRASKKSSPADSESAEAPSNVVAASGTVVHSPSPVTAGSEIPSAGEAGKDGEVTASPGKIVDAAEEAELAEVAEEVPGGGIDIPAVNTAVYLPSAEGQSEVSEIMIPSPPDQYKTADNYDPHTQPFTMHPSWIAVDMKSAPVAHALDSKVTDDPQSRSSEPRKEFEYAPASSFLTELLADMNIRYKPDLASPSTAIKQASKQAKQSTSTLLSTLEETTGIKIPPLSEPVSSNKPEDFKFQDRPLHGNEKNGLYVLAGLIGAGFLFGGAGKASKKQKQSGDKH